MKQTIEDSWEDRLNSAFATEAQRREVAQQQACARGEHAPSLQWAGVVGGHDFWKCPWCNQIV